MDTKEKLTQQSKAYFERYPGTDTFHATSDGMFFLVRGFASDHAEKNGLESVTIRRVDIQEKKVEEDNGPETPNSGWKKADIQDYLTEAGIGFDEKDTVKQLLEKLNETE